MLEMELTAAGALLKGAQRILLVSHIRPDGDAVGSLLGLGLALQSAGKEVRMVLADGVPPSLRHLPGVEQVHRRAKGDFDLVVVLDSSDLERTGPVLESRPQPDLNIDHHVTNLNFARLNLVDTAAAATAEILALALPAWGLPLDEPVASALLTGIITDTIGFRTSNMSARLLRCAAALVDAGADLPQLYFRALTQRSFQAMRLWGAGLTRLQREGGLVWTVLSQEDRRAANYSGRDDADLVNVLSSINGAEIVVIFVEQTQGEVKISWRAQPGYDVSQLALQFGGGGHPAASGAQLQGSLPEVQQRILDETSRLLQQPRQHPLTEKTT